MGKRKNYPSQQELKLKQEARARLKASILDALSDSKNNIPNAAEKLGISKKLLQRQISSLGILVLPELTKERLLEAIETCGSRLFPVAKHLGISVAKVEEAIKKHSIKVEFSEYLSSRDVEEAIMKCNGRLTKTAESLKISNYALKNMIDKFDLAKRSEFIEKEALIKAHVKCRGSDKKTAESLGFSVKTYKARIERHDLEEILDWIKRNELIKALKSTGGDPLKASRKLYCKPQRVGSLIEKYDVSTTEIETGLSAIPCPGNHFQKEKPRKKPAIKPVNVVESTVNETVVKEASLDPAGMLFYYEGLCTKLTPMEFRILWIFTNDPRVGTIRLTEKLDVSVSVLDVHISNLNKKLKKIAAPTVSRSRGYTILNIEIDII